MRNGGYSPGDFSRARVTNPNQSEIVRQRLYDWQLYPTAGQGQLTFFALPVGQGVTTALGGVVGSAKTYADTNMDLAGQLPSGKAFMVESIEVHFFAGASAAANTYTPATAGLFNAVAAAAIVAQANDVNTFYQAGILEFNILSKNYVRETPALAFPPKQVFNIDIGIANNSATTSTIGVLNSRAAGRPYYVDPEIALAPAQNFDVKLLYPGAVATPSGFNGRVGIILDGYFKRASQ